MSMMFERQDMALGGAFTTDMAAVVFGGAGDSKLGALVQNMTFNYSQNVIKLYEVGSSGGMGKTNIYYVGGRTNGAASVARIVGPVDTLTAVYKKFGDVCNACDNNITLDLVNSACTQGSCAGKVPNGKIKFTLKYCVLVQMGISVTAQDMVINEQTQLMFSGLQY